MTTDTSISAALRRLDAAPETRLTAAERERAEAVLARIVATPGAPGAPGRPPRHRRVRLLAGAGLAAGALATLPALLLGGGEAFGSWTPTPEPLSASAVATAQARCRTALDVPGTGVAVALAERRGRWTYVLLDGPRGEASCLLPDDGDDVSGSYSPDRTPPPTLAPGDIEATSSTTTVSDEGDYSSTEGYVGSDVTGVTVHVSSGLDIQASLANGRFAAWWPSVRQSSRHPGGESWSFTVHLTDGSTRDSAG